MSSQPNEVHEDDPMMNHLLELTHLQETSTEISFDDHRFESDYAEAMNLFAPSLDHHHHHHHHHHHRHHHHHVPNTSSSDVYLHPEHVSFDQNLHNPISETAACVMMDRELQETRSRLGRGKEVAIAVDDEVHHDHDDDHEEDGSGGCAKKQEHNAKERLRRMKLHASYLALGTLLLESPASKKKWSAPVIIDRAITYIPELQSEVEQLTLRKKQIMETIETKRPSDKGESSSRGSDRIPAVSVHGFGRDREAVVQICTRNEREDGFTNLLHTVEAQGMSILSASTTLVSSDQRIFSYHLHVKIQEDLCGADYITDIREKIISSLM